MKEALNVTIEQTKFCVLISNVFYFNDKLNFHAFDLFRKDMDVSP